RWRWASHITTNFGRSALTSTGVIVGCRNHRFDGRHFIPWRTRTFFSGAPVLWYPNSRQLDSGIGVGLWKLTAHFLIFPKNSRLNPILICPSEFQKPISNWP